MTKSLDVYEKNQLWPDWIECLMIDCLFQMELAFFSLEHVAKDALLKTLREFKAPDVLDLAKKYRNKSE